MTNKELVFVKRQQILETLSHMCMMYSYTFATKFLTFSAETFGVNSVVEDASVV